MKYMKYGILYAIGVGSGDSELITLKAANLLANIDVVFYPMSNEKTTALNIAKKYINKKAELVKLNFPMIKDKKELNAVWQKSSLKIMNYLKRGIDCAFIALGDISFYSSYLYIKDIIKENGYETKVIPGITSFSACASIADISIAESDDKVIIVPYLHNESDIEFYLNKFECIVLMKVYKNFENLKNIILKNNIIEYCTMFSNVGMENEKILRGKEILNVDKPDYFTTLIIRKMR